MRASPKSPALPWALAVCAGALLAYLVLNGGAYMERFYAYFAFSMDLLPLPQQCILWARGTLKAPWSLLIIFAALAASAGWGLRSMWGWPRWLRYLPAGLLFLTLAFTHVVFLLSGWMVFS